MQGVADLLVLVVLLVERSVHQALTEVVTVEVLVVHEAQVEVRQLVLLAVLVELDIDQLRLREVQNVVRMRDTILALQDLLRIPLALRLLHTHVLRTLLAEKVAQVLLEVTLLYLAMEDVLRIKVVVEAVLVHVRALVEAAVALVAEAVLVEEQSGVEEVCVVNTSMSHVLSTRQ